ncbi:hypothetical protein GM3708_187 [Geminocystis sp. NIES-3708]|uniref:hypothetical protein n=1 Tax=Geminocystis sp. NIES-3708 TaxID=1615909 RepID=UPI0005FCD58C|nr:hypothetical protein [Geminocystis sp. NIES-3708]BAQ59782.1 hypothetical protein GM3708_187 [Geminocystis sp. NIES-3708]
MSSKIIWQQNSENVDNYNVTNLQFISEWWSNLGQQKVKIAQRLIPETGNLNDIDWKSQRFDEEFILESPQIRGITVYGKKQNDEKEFGYTPQKLELDINNQELDIYLQSQSNTLIRFSVAKIVYQTFSLGEVEIVSNSDSKNHLILVRNKEKKVEITFTLNPNQQLYLLSQLAKSVKHNPKLNVSPETLTELLKLSE